MISDSSSKIIPVLSLQAVIYRLNSFLKSFTYRYSLLLPYYLCRFSTCFIFFLSLFLSMDSLLSFPHFFISFLRPSCLMPMYHFAISLVFIFGGLSTFFIEPSISYHSFLLTSNFICCIYNNLLQHLPV